MDFGEYNIKKANTFMGMEGHGYTAELYRGKKKVATCADEGRGGEARIRWLDRDTGRLDSEGYPILQDSEEHKIFNKHLASLPKEKSNDTRAMLEVDFTWFLGELVEKSEQDKHYGKIRNQLKNKLKKELKEKTLFIRDGKLLELNRIYDEAIDRQLHLLYKDYPIVILNTLPFNEAYEFATGAK